MNLWIAKQDSDDNKINKSLICINNLYERIEVIRLRYMEYAIVGKFIKPNAIKGSTHYEILAIYDDEDKANEIFDEMQKALFIPSINNKMDLIEPVGFFKFPEDVEE